MLLLAALYNNMSARMFCYEYVVFMLQVHEAHKADDDVRSCCKYDTQRHPGDYESFDCHTDEKCIVLCLIAQLEDRSKPGKL